VAQIKRPKALLIKFRSGGFWLCFVRSWCIRVLMVAMSNDRSIHGVPLEFWASCCFLLFPHTSAAGRAQGQLHQGLAQGRKSHYLRRLPGRRAHRPTAQSSNQAAHKQASHRDLGQRARYGRWVHSYRRSTLPPRATGMASAIQMSPAALVRLIALPLNRRFAIHTREGPEIQPASAR